MISQNRVTKPVQKGGETMYTLKQTQQIIKENPYTCNLDEQEQTEILNSKDNTRTFTITSELNTEDYSYPAIDYNITEIPNQKKGVNNMIEKENKLLQLIEDTEDIDDTLYYLTKLINHYLNTNQLDKRKAAYAEYVALVKEIEENNTELLEKGNL